MTFTRLVIQVAVLGLTTGVLGFLCGRYLWPRRSTPASAPPAAAPRSDDLGPALAELEKRLRSSESQVEQLRRAVAQLPDDRPARPGATPGGEP